MATITKTYTDTEVYPAQTSPSTWKLTFIGSNVTVTGESFQLPAVSFKYYCTRGAKRNYENIIMEGRLNSKLGSTTNLLTQFNYQKKGMYWSDSRSLTLTPSTVNTSSLFSAANKTSKTNTITLYADNIIMETAYNSNGDNPWGLARVRNTNLGTFATVTLNAPPTFETVETTRVSFDKTYIYAGLTKASVTVFNSQAQYGGDISSIKFTIGNQTVTSTSTERRTFTIDLAQAGTFTPTVTVTDSRGQVTTKTFDSITVNPYTLNVVNTKVERLNAETLKLDDEGTNAVLQTTFNYTEFTENIPQAPTVLLNNEAITPTWYTSWNNTTGFSNEIVDWSSISSGTTIYAKITNTLDTNTAHTFKITPQTNLSEGTEVSITLAQSFYLLVGRPGGHGLGIGMKPLSDDLYIQLPTYMIKNQYDSRISNALTITNNNTNVFIVDWNGAITIPTYRNSSWVAQRDNALLKFLPDSTTTLDTNYHPYISMKGMFGDWAVGPYVGSVTNPTYENDSLYLTYITDTNYENGTNTTTGQLRIRPEQGLQLSANWDYYVRPSTLALGTYVTTGVLTNGGKSLYFSIPTGRVFPAAASISKITFNIVARVGNSNASGVYIIKETSGGTSTVSFDSSKSCTFYNGNNVKETLTASMWTFKTINGHTNMYFNITGTSDYFFSGNATINGYVNNQPVAVFLDTINVTFTYS